MKTTGIVRKVDRLGRVVLPMELRRAFSIEHDDPLEIYVDKDKIVLQKQKRGCQECGDTINLVEGTNTALCRNCLEAMVAKIQK